MRRLLLLAALVAAPLLLAEEARAQADSTALVVRPGEAVYVRPPLTGVTSVRRRIRSIGGGAPAPVVIVVPPTTAAPRGGAVTPGVPRPAAGVDAELLDQYVRRLENRIDDLDRTLRRLEASREPTVVVLPEDATPETISAYRDSLAGLGNVQVVTPSTLRELPPAPVPEIEGEAPPVVFVEPTPGEVERVLYDTGLLRVAGVHFEFDESDLLPAARNTLSAVGRVLAANSELRVVVGGHTDAIGSDAYNQALSQRRADSVRDFLVATFGIDPSRLVPRGFGEQYPIATNENPTGRTLNRRVEFQVIEE